jgi:hypothetical protein
VKKIAAMAPNLNPSEDAFRPDAIAALKSMIDAIPAADRDTPQGRRELKVTGIMLDEPHIDVKALKAITAPTLLLASDHDLVRDEDTLEIYHHIPQQPVGRLPERDAHGAVRRPSVVQRYRGAVPPHPVREEDRINEMLKSLEKLRASSARPPK